MAPKQMEKPLKVL